MKLFFPLVFLLALATRSASQTVAPGTVGGPLCAGATVSIPYSSTGTFNAANFFSAQLSDANGSFSSPVYLGNFKSTASGTITGLVPVSTAAGTHYRIRILSSSPATTGTDNGSDLTINAVNNPSATITGTGNGYACSSGTVSFSVAASGAGGSPTYQWTVNGTNSGSASSSFSGNSFADGDVVRSQVTSSAGCSLPASVWSNSVVVRTDNATANSWKQVSDLATSSSNGPAARSGAASFSIGNKGYLVAGQSSSGAYLKDLWEFDPSSNTWTQRADFPGNGRTLGVGFSIGAKGYVGTGYDGTNNYKDFYEYDPATNSWTAKTDFGGAARRQAVAYVLGNKGYIATGYSGGSTNYSDVYEYDPAANTWTARNNYPGGARRAAASFTVNGKAYVGTGFGSSTYYKDLYEYDPTANAWTQKADFPGTGRFGAFGFGIGSKGYLGTGNDGGTNYYKDLYEYDPTANSWTQKADLVGNARQRAVALLVGSKGYIATGANSSTSFNDIREFDPSANSWASKVSLGGSAREGAASFSIGSKGYVATGFDGSGTYYKDLWEYDPSTNAWTQKADLPGSARYFATAFSIGGKGYLGTGNDGTSNLKDFYEYDPLSNSWTQKANLASVRKQAVGFSIGSKGYIGTGFTTGTYYADLYEYDPATDTWTSKAAFPGAGRLSAVGFSVGAKGYVGTGYDGTTYYNDFYAYDPATNSWSTKTAFSGAARNNAVGFAIGGKGYIGTGYNGSSHYADLYEYDTLANSWTSVAAYAGTARRQATAFVIGSKAYVGSGQNNGTDYSSFYEYSPTNTRISTSVAGTALASGNTVTVSFSTGCNSFTNGNVFTAQLSDARGSFSSPVNLGSSSGTSSGTIQATLPCGLSSGTAYRIRVVGSLPATPGTDNGTDLTVTAPSVTQPSNTTVCTGAAISDIVFGGSSVPQTTYTWTSSPDLTTLGASSGSGTGAIAGFTATNTGTTALTSTVTATPSVDGCNGGAVTFTIKVNPTPVPMNQPVNRIACNGAATPSMGFSTDSPVSGTSYSWTSSPSLTTLGAPAGSSTGTIASFSAANGTTASLVSTVTVTPVANGCSGPARTFTVTVRPTATLDAVSNQAFCAGTASPAISFSSPVSTATYTWTNDNTAIGLGASGNGSIASFTPTNGGTTAITATITVTPVSGTCNGTPGSFQITVNPAPTVNTVSNKFYCNGATTSALNFTGSALAGTTYNWSSSPDLTGLGAASGTGSGSIPPFAGVNNGTSILTSTVTVTPVANGCSGTAMNFNMSVRPTPTVDPVADQTLCNNTPSAAVTFTGAVSTATYNWTNDNPSIGLAGSGTGNIPSFTGVNNSGVVQTAHITVTPTVGTTCAGAAQTFAIRVYPAQGATISYPNSPYCASTGTANVFFSGTNGGTFSASPAGLSIDAGSGAINLALSNAGSYTVTYQLPGGGACGNSATTQVSIRPATLINSVPNQVFCNGSSTAPITFSGPAGITFSWTNSNTSIGLTNAGMGNIPSFNATNTRTTPVYADIRVLPLGGSGCKASIVGFRITVNPTPVVNAVTDQNLCAGQATAAINVSGNLPGATYTWTNDNMATGLHASGTGTIPSFTAQNNTGSLQTSNVTINSYYGGCSGNSVGFALAVAPAPGTLNYGGSPYCPAGWAYATHAGSSGGVYSATGGLALDAARGAVNLAASQPGTYTVTYSFAGGGACGNSTSATLTIKPQASVTGLHNLEVCSGTPVTAIAFTGTASSYAWVNSNTGIGLAASGTGTQLPAFTATNTSGSPADALITVTPLANGSSCTGKPAAFRIRVNPCGPIAAGGDAGGDAGALRLATVQLSPNPARSSLTVQLNAMVAGRFVVRILNNQGLPLTKAQPVAGSSTTVDLSALIAGAYWVQVQDTETGATVQRTFIKL